MDGVLLSFLSAKSSTPEDAPVEVSDRPLTAELFDALF